MEERFLHFLYMGFAEQKRGPPALPVTEPPEKLTGKLCTDSEGRGNSRGPAAAGNRREPEAFRVQRAGGALEITGAAGTAPDVPAFRREQNGLFFFGILCYDVCRKRQGESAVNIQIFGKNKCFETKKAERYFKERGVKYQRIDTAKIGMSKGELESVVRAVGGIDKLIDEKNQDSVILRYLARDEDKFEKLIENPKWLKTPVVRNGKQATVGYRPEVWKTWE